MRKIAFYTLGCKVNQYETEVMREQFEKRGYTISDFNENADIYLINTCSVTSVADKKSRQAIRRAHKSNPSAMIVVTGCYSQVNSEDVSKIEYIDIIIGNTEKSGIVDIIENHQGGKYTQVDNIMKTKTYEETNVIAHTGKTRAFIKIQDGCDNFCSYCIIPYARGPVRSRNMDDILSEARALAHGGYKEIVLTGIHIASYGKDTNDYDLADVLLRLHDISGINRIRLGSLELTPVLGKIADIADKLPKLCPHFHISLQSGSDSVLLRMRRRYTTEEYKNAVDRLHEKWPDAAITTDIMVGFPGETEKEFNESLKFAGIVEFAKMHIFPYSKRKGTSAAEMPDQVDESIKNKRAGLMQQTAEKIEKEFYISCIGKIMPVLIETKNEKGLYEGHAPNYAIVEVKGGPSILKQIADVKITGYENSVLSGEIV